MSKKIIVGNWKMNPSSFREAEYLFKEIKKNTLKTKNINTIICAPFIFLSLLKKIKTTSRFSLGAQDVFFESKGAFTGEISSQMIYDAGASYCIVGHSEKRYNLYNGGEDDFIINKKIKSLLKSKIVPILCIGEQIRDEKHLYFDFIRNQILNSLYGIPKNHLKNIIIAYEPIWAIGNNAKREATPKEINEIVIFIRKCLSDIFSTKEALSLKILYGGSVNKNNILGFLEDGGTDGFLIGRASLSIKDFTRIIDIVDRN